MRADLCAVIATSFALASCGGSVERAPETLTPTAPSPAEVSDRLTSIPPEFRQVRDKFIGRFGCNNSQVKLVLRDIDNTIPAAGDSSLTPVMLTEGDTIYIDPDINNIGTYRPDHTPNIIFHETAHACSEGILFDKPLTFGEGIDNTTVIGSEGLALILEGSTKDNSKLITFLDEGVAEWLASQFSEYDTQEATDAYNRLRETTDVLVQRAGMKPEEVIKFQQKSDVMGFIGRLFGLDHGQVTPDLVYKIVISYQDAYLDRPSSVFQELVR